MNTYVYYDEEGNLVETLHEVVTITVSELCFAYIEENKGKRPKREQIDKWVKEIYERIENNEEME